MSRHFIAGEWGSAVMRLYLCHRIADDYTLVAETEGPGVMGCADFEAAFFAAAQPWLDAHGPMPVVLTGMIGANIGWVDTGYAACPADAGDVHSVTVTARGLTLHIAPGLSCRNLFGLPDVVRGEEMQMLGWLSGQPRAADERHILCLPGRHVKWVLTQGARVHSFFTGMNGEMEDILLQHSLLGRGVVRGAVLGTPAFDDGVKRMFAEPSLALGHALFATRSRLVLGELQPETAGAFLSGLLVGGDIRDAMSAFAAQGHNLPVTVLGATPLAATYAAILTAQGHDAQHVSRPHLAVRGLFRHLIALGLDA